MRHVNYISWAAFSPNGASIVTASGETASVWETATCQPLTPPLQHRAHGGRAFWSADGKRLHTVTEDDYLQVWDLATGEPLTPPRKIRLRENQPPASRSPGAPKADEPLPLDTRPVADLVLLSQLLDLARIDANGKVLPLQVADVLPAWQSLRQNIRNNSPRRPRSRRGTISKPKNPWPRQTFPPRCFISTAHWRLRPGIQVWRNNRDEINKALANSTAQGRRPPAPLGRIRARDRRAGPQQIDLSAHYTAALSDSANQKAGGWDFADLPSGLQTFGNVPFDVRGVIYLNGTEARNAGLVNPEQASDIRIEQKCSRLHFFKPRSGGADEGTGPSVGKYLLHYVDGQTRELDIADGRHVLVRGGLAWLLRRGGCGVSRLGWSSNISRVHSTRCLQKHS